jgi:hypothetical protein
MSAQAIEEAARLADPISEKLESLVANLVEKGDIDFDTLLDAGYPEMTKGELSMWLNSHSSQLRVRQAEKVNAFQARVAAARAEPFEPSAA